MLPSIRQYEIMAVRGHYEVYCNGKFFCSADTYGEAKREIDMEVKDERHPYDS